MTGAVFVDRDSVPTTRIGAIIVWILVGFIYARLAEAYQLPLPHPLWFVVGFVIGLVFHEAGHALCAVLAKKHIRLVSIGVGSVLLEGRIGETKLEWRLLPFAGIVLCYPEFVRRPLPAVLFILGGVMGNAILAGALWLLDLTGAAPPAARTALEAIIFAQVVFIAVSLFPYRMTVGSIRIGSDGLQLLQLFLQPSDNWSKHAEAYTAELKRYSKIGAIPRIDAPYSARIFYQICNRDRWVDESAGREGRDALMRELASGELRGQEEMLVLDALLTYGLICDDQKLRPKLDEWSLRALALGPDIPSLLSTRGAILVSLGRYEEGKALLSSLPNRQDNASFDSMFDTLMNQVFLARAECALGNTTAARSLAAAAHTTAKILTASPAVALLMACFESEFQSALSS